MSAPFLPSRTIVSQKTLVRTAAFSVIWHNRCTKAFEPLQCSRCPDRWETCCRQYLFGGPTGQPLCPRRKNEYFISNCQPCQHDDKLLSFSRIISIHIILKTEYLGPTYTDSGNYYSHGFVNCLTNSHSRLQFCLTEWHCRAVGGLHWGLVSSFPAVLKVHFHWWSLKCGLLPIVCFRN